ncbi:hypothetical protein [Mucilaginibacter dorajii]|uniref:Uncharacterized protein n=1 Tax=Mucilaginibacter dorajii TaxID=692994 RepID=A0ABP7RA00_9SPHI|nr:hypothetical protein [Mucilaginibacter dorajii]MCS3737327.1 hypothetical protein [Mucilaginibacter dorajii]
MEKIYPKSKPPQSYLKDKQHKRKTAMAGVWILVVIGIIFIMVIVKFATSGGRSDTFSFNSFPGSDDAYQVAKQYVSPTLRSGKLVFAEDHYQFAKKSDSVFVIKSYVTSVDEKGEKIKTNFQITLKYNGGPKAVQDNWTMVDLKSDSN